MPRLIAFLRAINVGGSHIVKMDDLRRHFEALGFSGVETFIASGNVVFETRARNAGALEKKIENRLRSALGHDVATFVRTDAELARIAGHEPFPKSSLASSVSFNIAFLATALDARAKRKLMALETPDDEFQVDGREIYWLSRKRQGESTISNAVFEKVLGQRSTLRGVKTIKRMAAKYVGTQM